MLISSKGRYSLRLMAYVAQASDGSDTVSARTIADAEGLSLKYLEQLASAMTKAGYLTSVRGAAGGYKMAVDPSVLTAGDILRAAEGKAAVPVACMGLEDACPREDICNTLDFWAGLDNVIENYVDGVTLSQLVNE